MRKIIKNKNIYLLEDNCESMGAKYESQFTGTFGIAGTFSSFFSHHISTMEGGMISTQDEEQYLILKSLLLFKSFIISFFVSSEDLSSPNNTSVSLPNFFNEL